jgi:predicted dehydrogenase
MKQVRIGVIGVGGMGAGHCATMDQVPEARLAALCDVREDVAREAGRRFGVPHFTDAGALLDSGLVDTVVIATPHYDHPPIAMEAFARGIHVLSEKPVAVTVSQADRMIQAAERSGCAFGVMYQMRAHGYALAAKQLIDEGSIGEIYRTSLVMGWYRSQAYYDAGGWRATWAGEGGGVLINQAPHFLDRLTWLCGLPVQVSGRTQTRLHSIEVEDEAFATLEFANGAHGYLYASTTEAPSHEMLEVCGDEGKIVIHGQNVRYFRVKPGLRLHSREAVEMWGGPEVEEIPLEIPHGEGKHHEITANFCRHIRDGEPLIAPGREGLNAVELINGITLSSHTGSPVDLPVDRDAYDRLLAGLVAQSKAKTEVREQRVTDPNHV